MRSTSYNHKIKHYQKIYTLYLAAMILFLSILAFAINACYQQYPGNNYFPPSTSFMALAVLLMYLGSWLQFGYESKAAIMLRETLYFFLIIAVITIASNAAQYTPFPSIDKQILNIDTLLHINLNTVLAWTDTHPTLKKVLNFSYNTLPYQMSYLPLLMIITGRFHYLREHYFLLLCATLIGFSFYYFFPTLAPASVIDSPYFSESQKDTSLKFMQIHHHTPPTTEDGGLIAFPSFHTIWAWFCLYLLRGWSVALFIMLPVNLLLVASCLLLGWHYFLDIVGGIGVILIAHGCLFLIQKKSILKHPYALSKFQYTTSMQE